MKYATATAILVLAFALGCGVERAPLLRYEVSLIRPDGERKSIGAWDCWQQPSHGVVSSGCHFVYVESPSGCGSLFAPVGWYIESKMVGPAAEAQPQ